MKDNMQKRIRIIRSMICMIVLLFSVTGCNKNENSQGIPQDIGNTESVVASEPERFSYHGAKLTEIQIQCIGNDMAKMVESVINAVNTSQEQVDLSAYAKNSQMVQGAFQIAAYIDPIAEIAMFEEDNSAPGVFKINYGCSVVCQQFARTFSLLLRQRNIPVVEIAAISNVPFASNNVIYNGKTEGELFGINHMWNLMYLSGEWYGADITFAVSAKESTDGVSDAMMWQYFGMSDATMQNNFPSDTSLPTLYQNITIPSCDKELILQEKEQVSENRSAGNIVPENTQMEKFPIDYELDRLSEEEGGEKLVIDFGNITYHLTITLPEGFTQNKTYPVCYLLGNDADKESVALSTATIFVKISGAPEGTETDLSILEECDFSQNPAVFLNRFLCMIEALEKEYSVDTANRTLCGQGLGANMSLYILFQSDGLANNVFSHYVCLNPNLHYAVGGKSLMAWEDEYFHRCQELPVLLTIMENNSADSGQSARTGFLKEIIKKREYRNLILEFE